MACISRLLLFYLMHAFLNDCILLIDQVRTQINNNDSNKSSLYLLSSCHRPGVVLGFADMFSSWCVFEADTVHSPLPPLPCPHFPLANSHQFCNGIKVQSLRFIFPGSLAAGVARLQGSSQQDTEV